MKKALATLGLLFIPALTHATTTRTFKQIVDTQLVGLGDNIIRVIYALAFFFFLIGVFRYFFTEQGDEGRQKGKQMMFWGIISLFVLFAVWGIVRIFLSVLQSWA